MAIKLLYILAVLALLNTAKVMTKLNGPDVCTSPVYDPPCLCDGNYQEEGCICTENNRPENCICDAESVGYPYVECIYDKHQECKAGDAGLCICKAGGFAPVGCICPKGNDIEDLYGISIETCPCVAASDPRQGTACPVTDDCEDGVLEPVEGKYCFCSESFYDEGCTCPEIISDQEEVFEVCVGITKRCYEVQTLIGVPVATCPCKLSTADPREECYIDCYATDTNLTTISLDVCGCQGDTDPRYACTCTGYNIPTNCKCAEESTTTSNDEYDHDKCVDEKKCDAIDAQTPLGTCPCVLSGPAPDPRAKCQLDVYCYAADTNLTTIPVEICGCQGDTDPRYECICTQHGVPTNCKCAADRATPSNDVYDHDKCVDEKKCDAIDAQTSIETCPCPEDATKRAADPREECQIDCQATDTYLTTIPVDICGCQGDTDPRQACICTQHGVPTNCKCAADRATPSNDVYDHDTCVDGKKCDAIDASTPVETCACPEDAAKLATDPRKDTTCALSTQEECLNITVDTPISTCPCPVDQVLHLIDPRRDGVCKCPAKGTPEYDKDPRTNPKLACSSGSVRMTLGMIAAVVVIPVALFV